jgi:hypothetical protein
MTTVSRPAERPLAPTALSGITSKLHKILLVEVLVFLGNSSDAAAGQRRDQGTRHPVTMT